MKTVRLLAAAGLCCTGFVLRAAGPYLGPFDPVALLPAPPVPGGPEDRADRDEAFAVYSARTDADAARAQSEHRFTIFEFSPEIGTFFTKARFPRTAALVNEAVQEAEAQSNAAKAHWGRLRPYVLEPQRFQHPADHEPNASYPSGHSTRATLIAVMLAELFPQHRDAILAEGRLIGWTRVEAGVHTPLDIYAGRVLGQAVARQILSNPAFQVDLAAARAEAAAAEAPPQALDVRAFGAVGDGRHLDTGALNAAIAACARAGGGTVRVGPGTYRTGTIELRSHVTLNLERGTTLLASANLADYRSIGRSTEGRSSALLVAVGQEDIAIVGRGTIDGNGRAFVVQPRQPHEGGFFDAAATRQGARFFARTEEDRDGPDRMRDRPGVLALLLECHGVTLRDFTVVDAPNWCLHLACCQSAVLSGLTVRNSLRIPNADAIDLASSRDVRVTDCDLEAGDDGIAISPCADGYRSAVAENIVVSHCRIVSRSAAIRLGWAAQDIRRVRFDHLVIEGSNRGIGLFVRGRESIEDVSFSDISIDTHLVDGAWWGLGEPIHLSIVSYLGDGPLGHIRGISFERINATGEGPIVLYSRDPGGIRDIAFRDVSLQIRRSPLDADYGGNLDLRPATPASLGISRRDLAGLLAVNVDGLAAGGLHIAWLGERPPFFTAPVETEGCRSVTLGAPTEAGGAKRSLAVSARNTSVVCRMKDPMAFSSPGL